METLRNISLMGLLTLLLTFVPLVMAIVYVVRPSEHRLALMRPMSLVGLFATLTATALGFINTFRLPGREARIHARDLQHRGSRDCRIAGGVVRRLRLPDGRVAARRGRDGTSARISREETGLRNQDSGLGQAEGHHD